ncbi:hypothetical protein B566_EDAN006713 [Ephemera danica]|nr:hypothetical protein B566_EDAN006713 [Ephemera danica]
MHYKIFKMMKFNKIELNLGSNKYSRVYLAHLQELKCGIHKNKKFLHACKYNLSISLGCKIKLATNKRVQEKFPFKVISYLCQAYDLREEQIIKTKENNYIRRKEHILLSKQHQLKY